MSSTPDRDGPALAATNQRADNPTMRILVAMMTACVAMLGISQTGTAATQSEGPTPDVLVASHGVQVIAETGHTCTKVYLSTDFVHFHEITPVVPTKHNYAPTCGWFDASFVSPTGGWIVGFNGGGGPAALEHTTSGGLTWTRQRPRPAEGSEGELVGFTSIMDGWNQVTAMGASITILQHTTNGGATWTTVRPSKAGRGCWWLNAVFSSPSIGFESRGITAAWRTEDGGASWSLLQLPRPRSVPASVVAIYDTPVFHGLEGTLPVLYLEPKQVLIGFDITVNGGRSWRPAAVARVRTRVALMPRQPVGVCTAGVPSTSAPLPLLSASTPNYWWILNPGPANTALVMTVALGPNGATPWGHASLGLPSTARALGVTLTAADTRHAYVGVGDGREVIYQTSDGGARWTALPHGVP